MAVISRALALPSSLVPTELASVWAEQLAALPPLAVGQRSGQTVIMPGSAYPSSNSNSENTYLYPVHPFRLYGNGKPNIELAQATYNTRQFPCNGMHKLDCQFIWKSFAKCLA